MGPFDERIYEELYHGRPHGCVTNIVTMLGDQDIKYVAIGLHLCVVNRPLRVVGYHFAGEAISAADYRIWLHRSHDLTGLPVGPAIPNSDTGTRAVKPGTSTATRRDTPIGPSIYAWGNTITAYKYVDLLLPNVVELSVPGVYWIGIGRSQLIAQGEQWFGSYIVGANRGLRDMMSILELGTVGSIDPEVMTAMDPTKVLHNQNFQFPSTYGTMRICNIDVALVTEEWWNG